MAQGPETGHVVVLITAPDSQQAQTIADALVKEKLAACVSVLPSVQSLFWWEGKPCSQGETLLLAKSLAQCVERIVARVEQLHAYDVPEIIALPIVAGSRPYLRWMDEVLAGDPGAAQ